MTSAPYDQLLFSLWAAVITAGAPLLARRIQVQRVTTAGAADDGALNAAAALGTVISLHIKSLLNCLRPCGWKRERFERWNLWLYNPMVEKPDYAYTQIKRLVNLLPKPEHQIAIGQLGNAWRRRPSGRLSEHPENTATIPFRFSKSVLWCLYSTTGCVMAGLCGANMGEETAPAPERRLDARGAVLRRGRILARLCEGWAYDEVAREEPDGAPDSENSEAAAGNEEEKEKMPWGVGASLWKGSFRRRKSKDFRGSNLAGLCRIRLQFGSIWVFHWGYPSPACCMTVMIISSIRMHRRPEWPTW
jgi:hypothetical protein